MPSQTLEKLLQEHREARTLMDLLEEQALLSPEQALDAALMCDIMHYMTHYPDLFHHPREDAVLRFMAQVRPQAADWVPRLEQEHQEIAKAGKELLNLLRGPLAAEGERRVVTEQALRYVDRMRAHMRIEEEEFFPAAHRWLDEPDWEEIDTALPCPANPLSSMGPSDQYRVLEKQYHSRLSWLLGDHEQQ